MRKVNVLAGLVAVVALVSSALPLQAQAENQPSTPQNTSSASGSNGANPSGASSVIVEGKPAMRAGDANDPGSVEIVPDVFIEGKPAVVCKNGTKSGNASVFIHGKPVARAGDCK
ncbi:MAG: hypothetical protein P8Y47_12980 [Alphaproteobacteria bacterium]